MNIIREDLTGAKVILRREAVSGTTSDEMTRMFYCETGPGCHPTDPGKHITGHFLCNRVHGRIPFAIESTDIERKATEREILVATE
jgi:hypothetical protein